MRTSLLATPQIELNQALADVDDKSKNLLLRF